VFVGAYLSLRGWPVAWIRAKTEGLGGSRKMLCF